MEKFGDVGQSLGEYMVAKKDPRPVNRKTDRWRILNKRSRDLLGTIEWYGTWRQYVFAAEPGCVFNHACLDDLRLFLKEQNENQRKEK